MKFIFIFFSVVILSFVAILWWNNHKLGNNELANIIEKNGTKYFELTAERKGLAHDPISILFPEHQKESFLLPLNLFHNDTLLGSYIQVQSGYYKYMGKVVKKDKNLIVDLYYANTDEKKVKKAEWNGEYKISTTK